MLIASLIELGLQASCRHLQAYMYVYILLYSTLLHLEIRIRRKTKIYFGNMLFE